MHTKMLAYDRTIIALNSAGLGGTSFPIIHALIDAANNNNQIVFMFNVLANITQEPPSLPPLEHASAHILDSPIFKRKYAKAYLTLHTPAISLRKQIVSGARQALEEQYHTIIQRTVHSHPFEAQPGGNPSTANLVRAFCAVQVFFLIQVGEVSEAFQVLMRVKDAVDTRKPGFIDAFRIWAYSTERSLPQSVRDQLAGWSIPNVTTTTEDWLWMQSALVNESSSDENNESSLASLTKVLLAYGERHFEPATGTGGKDQGFGPAIASLWDHDSGGSLQVEAIHLAIALAYHGLLRVLSKAEGSDYIRQFVKIDAKEGLQYVHILPLSADHSPPGVGCKQLEVAWELVKRITVMANEGPMWEELVGGPGVIPTHLPLLRLALSSSFNTYPSPHLTKAIKLYELAGKYDTVVSCLAQALGNLVTSGSMTSGLGAGGMTWSATGDQQDRTKELEKTARKILTVYKRLGRGTGLGVSGPSGSNPGGKDRDQVREDGMGTLNELWRLLSPPP
ncbi:MAG: Nup93/Nic96-domain-containing protein [Lentinula lateritia]|nr:MAG: Nup93/Nic96-domain-containing protein [Lentinula lateritia]